MIIYAALLSRVMLRFPSARLPRTIASLRVYIGINWYHLEKCKPRHYFVVGAFVQLERLRRFGSEAAKRPRSVRAEPRSIWRLVTASTLLASSFVILVHRHRRNSQVFVLSQVVSYCHCRQTIRAFRR